MKAQGIINGKMMADSAVGIWFLLSKVVLEYSTGYTVIKRFSEYESLQYADRSMEVIYSYP